MYGDKKNLFLSKRKIRASLVAQWLGIRLPMQGTQVQALVREDSTCCGAAEPCAPQLLSLRSRAREPQLLKPVHLEPVLCGGRGHCNEGPVQCSEE